MEPFLYEGALILCSKNLDNLKRSNVVIFNNGSDRTYEIKRIIGLPYEKIEIVDGLLLINECKYEHDSSFKYPLNVSHETKQWELAKDQYFVIGDNTLHSTDSRAYGSITKSQLASKFICKLW